MGPTTYLYVPGNKLDFVEKAFNKGAENIFIDLEDSIPVQLKSTVRDSVCNFLKEGKPSNIYVRINSINSFQEDDISALNKIKFKNIVIPKLEKNSAIIKNGLHKKFEKIIGLIETAHGLDELKDIGQILNLERVGIGEVDFAADLGITEEEKYLEFYRSKLVYLSRLINLPKPIGGVFKNFTDMKALENFAHELSKLGFGSMQLIHPNQIEVVTKVFTPSDEEIEGARKLLDSISKNQDSGVGVFVNEKGDIVDAAMIRRAKEILNFIEKL